MLREPRSSRCARRAARRGRRSAPAGACTIEIFTSPGGYILGEESALLECMEGHRGEPRNKPPFPGIYGLWGKPTLMNYVETFADVPIILERGARLVEGAGRQRRDRPEVLRRLRATSSSPASTACAPARPTRDLIELAGGVHRRPRGRRHPARRRVVELPRPRAPRRAARLEAAAGGGLDARLGRADRRWPRAPTCSPRRRTCCASSATSRAASACRAGSARTKAHAILSDLLEQRRGRRRRAGARSTQLEETLRHDLDLRARARSRSGPVLSVLGMDRGGAEAREHPKDREDTET